MGQSSPQKMRKDAETVVTIMSCASLEEFRAWVAQNHSRSDGIWLRVYKIDLECGSLLPLSFRPACWP
jgi:hypothetical protein